MKTAIVILNYNGEKLLEKYLPNVIEHSNFDDTQVIVADNGSTDNSTTFIKSHFPNVRIIALERNYGFAQGYNLALQQIKAEYYILLNSDVKVSPNWLRPLVKWMDENPQTAACQPKIRSLNDPEMFEYAGACGGYIDIYGYPFCRGRILSVVEKDCGQYDSPCSIFWATGACLMIRSHIFWKQGGFDNYFFAHMEEIDLCWRINLTGKEIACIPQSTVFHIGARTLKRENPYKTYLNFRNNLLMLHKNLPESIYKKVFFVRFLLDYTALFQNIFACRISNAASIFKARRDFRKVKKQFDAEREKIQKSAIINFPKNIFQQSLIVNFYLKRKHYFNQYFE